MKNLKMIFGLLGNQLLSILFFTSPTTLVIAQNDMLQGPRNIVTMDLAGVIGEKNKEYAFSYERRLNKKASFVGTVSFMKNQDEGHLKEGHRAQEYTEKRASGQAEYGGFILKITDTYTNRVTFHGGSPWSIPEETSLLTGGLYVKGGYKIHKVKKWKKHQMAHWYFMPELLVSVETYNDYEIAEQRITLGHQTGHVTLPYKKETWESWDIRQTWDIQRQKKTHLVLGGLTSLGYQILIEKRVLIGVQGTIGVLLPMDEKDAKLGGMGQNNFYGRFSLMAGVSF